LGEIGIEEYEAVEEGDQIYYAIEGTSQQQYRLWIPIGFDESRVYHSDRKEWVDGC